MEEIVKYKGFELLFELNNGNLNIKYLNKTIFSEYNNTYKIINIKSVIYYTIFSTYIDTVVEKCKYIRRDYLINKILNEK